MLKLQEKLFVGDLLKGDEPPNSNTVSPGPWVRTAERSDQSLNQVTRYVSISNLFGEGPCKQDTLSQGGANRPTSIGAEVDRNAAGTQHL